MIITFIKYYILIICSFYIFFKLLRITPIKNFYFFSIPFMLIILPSVYLLRKYAAPFSILVMVMLFTIYLIRILNTPLILTLNTSVISFGISYFIFSLLTVMMSPIRYFLALNLGVDISNLITVNCIGIVQFLSAIILFKIKRLKNGMPILHEYRSRDSGAYVSILLLIAASFFGLRKSADLVFIIPIFFSLLCGISLLFWWRSSITRKYLEKVKSREIEELQKTINENTLQLEQLRQNNDELSKIIHKDNKLIPAMEYAVREYLTATEHAPTTSSASSKGKELLDQLACLTKERTGILTNYEANNKKLSPTGIPSIDTLLAYMSRKAQAHEINFDVTLSGSITQLTKQSLEEADLRTLLADLIDNAIIATKKSTCRNILINLGFSNGWYSIDIFDSGEFFKAETLSKIGLKRTTTHAKEGGSGIGLMTVFELIKQCQASFIIEELPDSQLFTKKVSVRFDQLGNFELRLPWRKLKSHCLTTLLTILM